MPKDSVQIQAKVAKVDQSLGLVFGYALVCKEGESEYWDAQGHHIPEPVMLKAAHDYAAGMRVAGEMHVRDQMGRPVAKGQVLFVFPLTTEIAAAMGLKADRTGMMIGAKPAPDVLAKFIDGTYTGFSIGGSALMEEEPEEPAAEGA